MKTKFILSAMCLPLAFAACTNEEVFVENQNALENAPVVELKVAATYGADALESRMVNNNGTFLWEGTDVLGATWNRITRKAETGDVVSAEIFSNNKFVNTLTAASASADFTTQATTVVGDYVFYYPYNTDVTKDLASGIVYSLPEPQEYDPTGDKMMNNNFMISPNVKVDGNEPGELTLPLTLRSIYGYGLLNLKLSDGLFYNGSAVSSVNIQKIIINYTSNVAKDGKIALGNIPTVNLNADYIESLIAGESDDEDLNEACEGKTEAEVYAILFAAADKALTGQTDNYSAGTVKDLTAGDNKIGQVSITCVSDENPDGVKLSLNSTFSTRVLLPTANSADVTITVYTDKGKWQTSMVNQKIKANHTANLANLNRQSNGKTSLMIDALNLETGVFTAITEADFIATVKNLTSNATIVVGDFSLTPAAIAAIPEDVTLTFNSGVKFEGDMTLKNMNFNYELNVPELKAGNIKLGANVTAYRFDVTGADVEIESSEVNIGGVSVTSGTLNVNAKNEDGDLDEITSEINADETEEGVDAKVVVNSPLNGRVSVVNGAEVEVNNTVKELIVGENSTAVNNSEVDWLNNEGVLNNAGTIKKGISEMQSQNYGVINQLENGVILGILNVGKVITVANSEVTATNIGDIIYVEGARVAATNLNGGDYGVGAVTYEAPSTFAVADFEKLNDAVTKVLFNNDFTVAITKATTMVGKNNVTALEFKGNLTVTSGQVWTLNANSKLIFTGATSTVNGGSILNVAAIEVGVAEDTETEAIEEVATNVTIVKGTTIEGVNTVKFNSTKAQVWNEGNVYHAGTAPEITGGYWKANPIDAKPSASAN